MDLLHSSLRNLQGVVKLNLEIADLLIDFRQDVEMSILSQVQQSVGDAEPASRLVSRGVELTTLAFNRQHALERDLLARLQQFMDGRAKTPPPTTYEPADTTPETQYATGEAVHVTSRASDSPLVIPLKLRNHHDAPQTITLHAVHMERAEGSALPINKIHFHPATCTLPAQAAATIYVVVEIDATFRAPADYWTEIRVGGSDPKRFPLCLTLLPPDQPEIGTA